MRKYEWFAVLRFIAVCRHKNLDLDLPVSSARQATHLAASSSSSQVNLMSSKFLHIASIQFFLVRPHFLFPLDEFQVRTYLGISSIRSPFYPFISSWLPWFSFLIISFVVIPFVSIRLVFVIFSFQVSTPYSTIGTTGPVLVDKPHFKYIYLIWLDLILFQEFNLLLFDEAVWYASTLLSSRHLMRVAIDTRCLTTGRWSSTELKDKMRVSIAASDRAVKEPLRRTLLNSN